MVGSPRCDSSVGSIPGEPGAVEMFNFSRGTAYFLVGMYTARGADEFGATVANVGDVTADGAADIGVARPGSPGGESRGSVTVYSLDVLWDEVIEAAGTSTGDRFGHSIADAPPW